MNAAPGKVGCGSRFRPYKKGPSRALEVIDRSVDNDNTMNTIGRATPPGPEGAIFILRGTLAPDGAVVKASGVAPSMWNFEGTAKVFEGEESAIEATMSGQINPGTAIIIRNEGPKGGPGMREMYWYPSPTSVFRRETEKS